MKQHENSIHPNNPTDIADSAPESKNPNQPLLFAPGVLLRCGMRDAHSFPLVGRRDRDGVIRASWRESPSTALDEGAYRDGADGEFLRGDGVRL